MVELIIFVYFITNSFIYLILKKYDSNKYFKSKYDLFNEFLVFSFLSVPIMCYIITNKILGGEL